MGKLADVDPRYAQMRVAEFDARIATLDAERKSLIARRAQFAPFVPQPVRAKRSKKSDD